MREIVLLEDCFLALGDRLVIAADELGNELVGAFADQPPYGLKWNMKPKLFEGFGEGARVRVVAVDERAVDVEDDALEFQTAASGERGSKSFQPLRHTPSARPRSRAPYSRSTFTALVSLP